MAQDYYAVLVQPTSQANARALTNNNEPMTPARTKDAIERFVASVKSYGATGDGSTNDYSAIAAAITAVDAAGGGFVYFPVGTYMVGQAITVPSGVILTGEGYPHSTIQANSSLTLGHVIELDGVNCGIEHLWVKGRPSTATQCVITSANCTDSFIRDCEFSHGQWMIYLIYNCRRVVVERCYCHDHNTGGGHCIELNDADDCIVRDCYVVGGGAGDGGACVELYLETPGELKRNIIEGNVLINAPEAAIQCFADSESIIRNNRIINPQRHGVYLASRTISATTYYSDYGVCDGNVIQGANQSNTFGVDAVFTTSGSRGWTISNNTIRDSLNNGVLVGSPYTAVINNRIINPAFDGIYLATTAVNAQVHGNIILDASDFGVGSRNGINVEGQNCVLVGNTCYDRRGTKKALNGILIQATANNNYLSGNVGTAGTSLAFLTDSGTGTTVVT